MYVHTPFSTIGMIYDRSRTPAILPVFDPPSLFRFLTQHIWKFRLRDSAGTKLVSIRVCEGKCNDDIQSKFRNSFVARKKDFCFEFLLRNFCIFYFFFILSILRIFRYNYTYNSKLSRRKRESSAPYLQDAREGWISVLRLQSCNSAASKRANNKIGFGHPCRGAYVARDSEGGFSEGGQAQRQGPKGPGGLQDQRRPAAIPHLLRDILRENWHGQARVARCCSNFDHFTCGTCPPAAVAVRNTIAVDKFTFGSVIIMMLFDDAHQSISFCDSVRNI